MPPGPLARQWSIAPRSSSGGGIAEASGGSCADVRRAERMQGDSGPVQSAGARARASGKGGLGSSNSDRFLPPAPVRPFGVLLLGHRTLREALPLFGLYLHVPPKPFESWYYPDNTLTFCITRYRGATPVPGTTSIIGRFKDSGGLLHWAFQQGKSGRRHLYEEAEKAADV